MSRLQYIAFLLLFSGWAFAQVPAEDLEMELESIAQGNEENEVDLTQLAENLQALRDNPVEVNFAEAQELKQIPYLNIFQVNNLLLYHENTGYLYTPYELMAIKGFSKTTIQKIRPYLSFSTKEKTPDLKLKNIWKYSRHNMIARTTRDLQQRRGYTDKEGSRYLGDPQDYYLRYRGRYSNNISLGLNVHQDAGEPFSTEYQDIGVDFIAGHLALQNYGNLKNLVVGDYQAEFGQGLALWSSLAFGKGAEAIEIKRYSNRFRPFTGSEENRYFRGAAATYELGGFDLSAFYSSNPTDANVTATDSLDTPVFVSSLQSTGLHRTANELADKNTNTLETFGGNINYIGAGFSIGATAVQYQLETPLEQSGRLYQKYRFNGKRISNYSLDFNYLYRDLNLFGEIAASDNGAMAQTVGLQSNPANGFYATLLYRNFDKKYQALYNAPFAENGSYGEEGAYLGIQWRIDKTFLLKSYLDVYRFRWLRFRTDAPSRGRDLLAQLEMFFTRKFTAYIRVKSEVKEVNPREAKQKIPALVPQSRSSARLHTVYKLSGNLRLSNRLQLSFFDQSRAPETGSMIYQDVRYTLPNFPLQLTTRYALINTESFDTRIYAYENDLLYSFSIPPYYGRSSRFYLLADWDVTSDFSFQIKYSLSTFYDRDEISSGLARVDGNKLSEIKAQVRVKF